MWHWGKNGENGMIFQTILEGIRLDALPVLVCAVGMAVIAAAPAGIMAVFIR